MYNKETVRLVGTNHVSFDSKKVILDAFFAFEPDIIALELDRERLQGLLSGPRKVPFSAIFQLGVIGYLFVLIGSKVQNTLAKKYGVRPGEDMLTGLEIAKQYQKKVSLVDQPVRITLKRLSKLFTFREKMRVGIDLIRSFVSKKFVYSIGIDPSKVPDEQTIIRVIAFLEKRYPSVYKALIHERNIYMCRRIKRIQDQFPQAKILCIVGAGHIPGMEKLGQ
ncbi:MAG: TraB domain-containing protein [Candidatus Woesearchaeota archaeon]